jgi:V/A-type H+-transporting ATPase subunit D
MREVAPTRASALELADERRLMQQGYEFLDEKRVLLATEMLRQLAEYQRLADALTLERANASRLLAAAVERHGLDNLQVYPVPPEPPKIAEKERTVFLGVPLFAAISVTPAPASPKALDPSPEAIACREAFERLLDLTAKLGMHAGNLHRLAREYRRTDRRAKALENVLLPEVEDAIKRVDEQLDTIDREEVLRAHWSGGAAG